MFLWTILFYSILLGAQETPPSEPQNDLRSHQVLGEVQTKDQGYVLEKSSSGQYFILNKKDQNNQLSKIPPNQGKELDRRMSEIFIELFALGECKSTDSFIFRGEKIGLCPEQDKKHPSLKKLIEDFVKLGSK